MTKIGLKRKQMTWRFFAMLLAVVLLFQNTALSAFAADGTPGEGATVTSEADAGISDTENSDAENTTTDGTGSGGGTGANGETGGQTPTPGATDGNTGGQVTPGTGDSSNGGDTQPVDGNTPPGTNLPPQPGNIVYPEGNDPIVMPGENNNPGASDALIDDTLTDGEEELTLEEEEETESADALNEGAEVPEGTVIRLGVSGAGGFKSAVIADENFDEDFWIYTHTVKTDTTIANLMTELLSKVEPAGNVGTFGYFSTHDWDESINDYVSFEGEAAVRYAVEHSGQVGLDLYAFFNGNAQISVKSEDNSSKPIWRMKIGDELTLTASPTVYDQLQYINIEATGVQFGEWHFQDDTATQQPVSISWDENNPGTATIKAESVGSTKIIVPLLALNAKYPFSWPSITVVVDDGDSEDKIPADTSIIISINGAGTFSEEARSSDSFNEEYWHYTYTVPEDTTAEALIETLSSFVEPVANVGRFENFTAYSYDTQQTIRGADALQYAVLSAAASNSTTAFINAQFSGYVDINVSTPSGHTSKTIRLSPNEPLTITASMNIWDNSLQHYVAAGGVRFGEWYVNTYSGQDAPFSLSWNEGTPDQATLTPIEGANGIGTFNIPVYVNDGSPHTLVNHVTITVIVGDAKIPKDTSIPLHIWGPGVFTNKAKSNASGTFNSNSWYFTYVTPREMSCEELLKALEQYVAPAGNFGKFSYWEDATYSKITDTSAFNYSSITARFDAKPSSVTTNLPDTHGHTVNLYDNSKPFTLTANLKLLNDYYQPVSTTVTGVKFGDWFIDGTESEETISIQTIKPGQVKITPKAVGRATIYLPLVAVDGVHTSSMWSYEFTVVVKPAAQRDYTIQVNGPGQFTDIVKNDKTNYNGYSYNYSVNPFSGYEALLEELNTFVEPLGNLAVSAQPKWGYWKQTSGGSYAFQQINSDAMVPDGTTIYAQFDMKSFYWTWRDNNDNNIAEPNTIHLRAGQEPEPYTIEFVLPEENNIPVTGVKINWQYANMYSQDGSNLEKYQDIVGLECTGDNPSTLYLYPHSAGAVQIYLELTTPDGKTITSFQPISVVVGEYANLTYEAYDSEGNPLPDFYHNNPGKQAVNQKTLTLSNAMKNGYRFDGWFLSYDENTHSFDIPVENKVFENPELTDTTLYAKFSRIIPAENIEAYNRDTNAPLEEAFYLVKGPDNRINLQANVLPDTASQEVIWSSSDTTVAKIGVADEVPYLEGLKEGNATITVRAKDDPTVKNTFSVTVVEEILEPHHIEIEYDQNPGGKTAIWAPLPAADGNGDHFVLKDNGNIQNLSLKATVKTEDGKDASNQTVTWTAISENAEGEGYRVLVNEETGVVTIKPVSATTYATIQVASSDISLLESVNIKIDKSYQLSFENEHGEVPASKEVGYDTWPAFTPVEANLLDIEKGAENETGGYTFDGWYYIDAKDGNKPKELQNPATTTDFFMPAHNLTLTARWIPIDYTVTAHYGTVVNGEWVEKDSYKTDAVAAGYPGSISYTAESDNITLPAITLDGYSFLGWFEDAACTKKITKAIPASSKANKDVYASLKKTVQSIEFLQDKTVPVSLITRDINDINDENKNIPLPATVTPVDHDFGDVIYKSSNTAIATVNTTGTVTITATKAGSTTITASVGGKSASYVVRVEGNAVIEPDEVTISAKLGTTDLENGTTVDADKNKTAQIKLTAKVLGSDGSESVPATVQDVIWSVDTGDKPLASITQAGVLKLNLTSAGPGPEPDEIIVTAEAKADRSKFDVWTIKIQKHYTLSFEAQKGVTGMPVAEKEMKYLDTKALTNETQPKRTGYDLTGWKIKGKSDDSYDPIAPDLTGFRMPAANTILVAQWALKKLDITLEYPSETGIVSKTLQQVSYGSKPSTHADFPAGSLVSDSSGNMYRITGWYNENTFSTTFNVNAAYNYETDKTVYGKVERLYPVHFELNGGNAVLPEDQYTQYKTNGETVKQPAAPTKPGQVLEGWYEDSGLTKKVNFKAKLTGLGTGTDEKSSVTYYAKWKPKTGTYDVTLIASEYTNEYGTFTISVRDKNNVQVQDGIITFNYNDLLVQTVGDDGFRADMFTAEGFELEGWYTDKARTKRFDIYNTRITKNLTLYAKWLPDAAMQHTVSFYHDGSSVKEITVEHGIPVPASQIPMYDPYSGRYLKEVLEFGSSAPYNMSAPVTVDTDLALVYFDASDTVSLENVVVITNRYDKLSEAELPTGYKWPNAVASKSASSYASKGTVMIDLEYTAAAESSAANKCTVPIPVYFATVTGFKMVPKDSIVSHDNEDSYISVQPLVNKKALDTLPDAVVSEVKNYLAHQVVDKNLTVVRNIAGFPEPVEIDLNTGFLESENELRFDVRSDVLDKKHTATYTCKLKQPSAKALTASCKVTLLAPPTSHFGDAFRLLLNDSDIDSLTDGDTFRGSESQLKEPGQSLVLRGSFAYHGMQSSSLFKVSSGNTKILQPGTVKWKGLNDFEIPLTIKAHGAVTLTLTPNNADKAPVVRLHFNILPDKAMLDTASVTLNKLKYDGALLNFTESYEDSVYDVSVSNIEPDATTKKKLPEGTDLSEWLDWFEVREVLEEDNTIKHMLYLGYGADINSIPDGTYTLTLENHGTGFDRKLKVSVVSTRPTLKITQEAALNANRVYGTAMLMLESKEAILKADIQTPPLSPFEWYRERSNNGYLYVVEIRKNQNVLVTSSSDKSITVSVEFDGYRDGFRVEQTVNIKTEDKQPSVKLSKSSLTFYEDLGLTRSSTLQLIVDGETYNSNMLAENHVEIEPDAALAKFFDAYVTTDSSGNYMICVERNDRRGAITTSGNLLITHANYEKPIKVPLKITMQKAAAFKPSLSASTIQLNRMAEKDYVSFFIDSNAESLPYINHMNGYSIDEESLKVTCGSGMTPEKLEKLDIHRDDTSYNLIHMKWKDPDDTLPAGTYKLTVHVTFQLPNGETKEYAIPLTLKVVNTALSKTVTVTQRGTLYSSDPDSEMTLSYKLSGLNGTVTEVTLGGRDADLFTVDTETYYDFDDVLVSSNTGYFYLFNPDTKVVPGYNYDVSIATATVTHPDGSDTVVPVNKKLTVKYK